MPQKLIIDSSVIVKWLNEENEDHINEADQILKDCQNGEITLYTPEISKYEVANALLKGKKLTITQVKDCFISLYTLPLTFLTEKEETALVAYEIALKNEITYYDAVFLAHAKTLQAVVVTDNPKHQGKDTTVKVIPLAQYGQR